MTSTFSPNLKLELMGTGDQSGTWGDTTNTNLGVLIEQAICGYVTQTISNAGDTVLAMDPGSSSVARNNVLELTGTLSASRNLIVPAIEKSYTIYNNTLGGFAVVVKVAGQTGVSVPSGKKAIVYVNGIDVIEVVNDPVSVTGTQTLTNKTLTSPTITGGSISGGTGSFTTLAASSTVSGAGFSTYLASPPAIGGTTAAAITGTTITATTRFVGAHDGTVGATTPNTGSFTTLAASSTVSGTGFTNYFASPPAIGSTTANTGRFSTLNTLGNLLANGSAGTSGQFLQTQGAGSPPIWATVPNPFGVVTPTNTQTFNASGTWTKPGSGTYAIIRCIGGGGGGSGNGTAGTGSSTTFGSYVTAYGGGGGSSGGGGSGGGGGEAGSNTAPGGAAADQKIIGLTIASLPTLPVDPNSNTPGSSIGFMPLIRNPRQGDGGANGGAGNASSNVIYGGGGGANGGNVSGGSSVYGGGGGATGTGTGGAATYYGGTGGNGAADNAVAPGGGGGANGSTAGGGGGGAFVEEIYALSELTSTVAVTIGAGGAAQGGGFPGKAGRCIVLVY